MNRRVLLSVLTALALPLGAGPAALAQGSGADAAEASLPLFAVEITLGPRWDASKPPQEQLFFREHSQNLKRLRDAGTLVMGARYADKGLVVLAAPSDTDVRALMDADPSIRAEVFKYQVHPFNVFYGGSVQSRARRPAP